MTTAFIPTTRVSVLSDVPGETAAGDEIDSDTVVRSGVAATWRSRRRQVHDPVTGRTTLVDRVRVRMRPGTVVVRGQRLRDERTGQVGTVDEVEEPRGVSGREPVVAWLVRVTP